MLNTLQQNKDVKEGIIIDSFGPVDAEEKIEEDTSLNPGDKELLSKEVNVKPIIRKQKRDVETKQKRDPEMELEGNLKLNKVRRQQFKKEKKKRNREAKAALQLSTELKNVKIKEKVEGEDYDFKEDFIAD